MSLADEIEWRPSPNYNVRVVPEGKAPIRHLILHYTGMQVAEEAVAWLTNPESGVSSHYFVHEDGRIVQMVEEMDRAWHAGKSRWRGEEDLNSSSIGIEIQNPGHEWGYRPFPDEQMRSVLRLASTLCVRHRIDRANVIGHSDIAPTRKEDPGELFDWPRLAMHRIALARPEKLLADPGWGDGAFGLALERFGYDIADLPAATRAFQRHFRQQNVDGIVDGETRAVLFTLQVLEEQRLQQS
ncbi:N-acetylmuramoyl-L-alanine amidase [Sandaracinobacteroides hominis]|uniref:N-acetylmuramoyl-L-alanine amidase n=1 Tax=Sandaracinobacteroides hominis TaxID=2780086 RepID=UPI0018F5A975|nr:N-acetylmuramoyl-L-alanine amidase [Sandaracinobacteroides hominis]